ncbi:MAG: response regulator transcription factor [Dehalogenimonas sp.]
MRRVKVLLVDDDPIILKFVRVNFVVEGWEILVASNGYQALDLVEKELPELIILDIMMPGMDGFKVISALREWIQIPIIVLSARGEVSDRIRCLNLGADDYLTKPFNVEELVARARAMLRRGKVLDSSPAIPTQNGPIKLDVDKRTVFVKDQEVKLTPTEYMLIREFVLHPNKVLTHTHLLTKAWGSEYINDREYLHVMVNRLRSKLEENPSKPLIIQTITGIGYMYKY